LTVRNTSPEPLRIKVLVTSAQLFSVRPIRTTVAPGTAADMYGRP